MGHLKLGVYSFVVDGDELGLENATPKQFTRNELPDKLKPMFDICKKLNNQEPMDKAIFIIFKKDFYASGFCDVNGGNCELNSNDGIILRITWLVNDRIEITYNEY